MADDARECVTDERLRKLVKRIYNGLLLPIKASGGKTPTDETPFYLRKDFEDSFENTTALDLDSITKSPQKRLRDHCLQRYGFRCVATKYCSAYHPRPKDAKKADLEVAHIILFNIASFDPKTPTESDRHANIWVNISRYFPTLEDMSFTLEQLNTERNAMMLERSLHWEFGAFRLCFIATGVDNQYHVKTFEDTLTVPCLILPADRLATFQPHKGGWDLPDPELLRIHASLTEFFNMSGHGKRIDRLLTEFEELGGLASDGSTNVEDLLASRLLSLAVDVRE